jgi:uncharacterized membrane protein
MRMVYTNSHIYFFLNWNLFLAFIPWFLSGFLTAQPGLIKKKWYFVPVLPFWMLFFPNAPYILTDLFHLRLQTSVPIWYDLIMILLYAWTGLLFAFFSLWHVENILGSGIGRLPTIIFSSSVLYTSAFGIYVGRYMRFNSWDLITKPLSVMGEISQRFANASEHPRTWGMTLLLGTFLNVLYWSFNQLRNQKINKNSLIEIPELTRTP